KSKNRKSEKPAHFTHWTGRLTAPDSLIMLRLSESPAVGGRFRKMANSAPSPNFIGIDLCGAALRAAVVSNDGDVVERRDASLDRDKVIEQVAHLVSQLRDVAPNVQSVGIAIPGLINRMTDQVIASRELPAGVRADLHARLMKATGLRFELEND